MTPREKIAHLLRRFGLGATQADLDRLEPLGVDATLNWLIDYEKTDEGFPLIPWEFCHEDGKEEIYVDPYRFATYWSVRLAISQRPLEQRLCVFWHNHFAVSGTKVEFGPMMLAYLEAIRRNAAGPFPKLLQAVSREPAMIKYLDTDTSLKGHPNENFARELLELFTMGQGNYTEKDIQEASRAFTGWGIRYVLFENGGDKVQERIRTSMLSNTPMVAYSFSPDLHDDEPKTVLGKTATFSGEDLLAYVGMHHETASHITAKLWRFFASDTLPESTHQDLIRVYEENGGNTRAVLREIARQDAFWADTTVRRQVKSPVDFVVPIVRQLGLQTYVLASRGTNKPDPMKRAPKPVMDVAGIVWFMMTKQGMSLFFPPNVGGWEWGQAWITSANMFERTNLANLLFGVGQPDKGLAGYFGQTILATNPTDDRACVDRFLTTFDANLPEAKRLLLVKAFTDAGGKSALATPEGSSKALAAIGQLVFGSPEFQLC
ncbi:MAG: DUF1800 domain-containing protein [Fimbriimonas sp.]